MGRLHRRCLRPTSTRGQRRWFPANNADHEPIPSKHWPIPSKLDRPSSVVQGGRSMVDLGCIDNQCNALSCDDGGGLTISSGPSRWHLGGRRNISQQKIKLAMPRGKTSKEPVNASKCPPKLEGFQQMPANHGTHSRYAQGLPLRRLSRRASASRSRVLAAQSRSLLLGR